MSGGLAPASQPAAPGPRSVESARAPFGPARAPAFPWCKPLPGAGDCERRWPWTVRGRGPLRAAVRARL